MTTNPSVKKKETQKLKEMSNEENNKRQELYSSESIYGNLDPTVIAGGMIQTLSGVVEDITNFGQKEDDNFINIFFKDDRMFFLGIFCLGIAVLLFLWSLLFSGGTEKVVYRTVAAQQYAPQMQAGGMVAQQVQQGQVPPGDFFGGDDVDVGV